MAKGVPTDEYPPLTLTDCRPGMRLKCVRGDEDAGLREGRMYDVAIVVYAARTYRTTGTNKTAAGLIVQSPAFGRDPGLYVFNVNRFERA